jgi:phospholipase/carboxylesterase
MTSGIHHITLITRNVQANVDFYAAFLVCVSSSGRAD